MVINEEQQLGRAKNAALSFMERRIAVPKIYLDTVWDGQPIDLLAIDRDGVGDVHVVLLFARRYLPDGRLALDLQEKAIADLTARLSTIPANYKYICGVDVEHLPVLALFRPNTPKNLMSPDGIGRIGLVHINATVEDEPEVQLILKPERFRAKIAKLADEYVQQHEADWEIRA